jgi:hypothetical protein
MLDSLLAEARHATPRHATPHRVMLRPPVTLLLVALRASMEAAAAADQLSLTDCRTRGLHVCLWYVGGEGLHRRLAHACVAIAAAPEQH